MDLFGLSAEEVWQAASARLAAESKSVYSTYFANMIPLSLDDNNLKLGVSDEFVLYWVQKNFVHLLEKSLLNIGGSDYSFTLEPGHIPPAAAAPPVERTALRQQLPGKNEAAPDLTLAPAPAPRRSVHSYNFGNFVVGMSNRHAFAAAKAVAAAPGECYNPLFIYGSNGVGKTHLLQAIAAEVRQLRPELVVRSATCDEILNDYYDLLLHKRGNFADFRASLRDVDVLLIDDIHRLAKKTQMQEEFFNIFNQLYRQNKQIVFTSDRQPCEISDLDKRLSSRFEQGMISEVGMLEYEERIVTLRMWRDANLSRAPLADRYLEFLAGNISSNVRRLKGCFLRLSAYIEMNGSEDISMEEVEDLLHAQLAEENSARDIRPETIQQLVAQHFGLSVSDIIGMRRNRQTAEPRMVAMYLCRELTKLSSNEIGSAFGRTHANVLHAAKTIAQRCKDDCDIRRSVSSLKRQLQKH